MSTLHIDFDSILYQLLFTSKGWEGLKTLADGCVREKLDILNVVNSVAQNLENEVSSLCKVYGGSIDNCILYLSAKDDDEYHRHKFFPYYKLNRVSSKLVDRLLPECTALLKGYIVNHKILGPKTILHPGMEADDLLGMASNMDILKPYNDPVLGLPMIACIDKDLQTIPNVLLSYANGKKVVTTSQSSTEFIHYQMVVGDSSDGFKGLPRQGEKAYLDNWQGMKHSEFKKYYKEFAASKGLPDDYFEQMKNCARMLRGIPADWADYPELKDQILEAKAYVKQRLEEMTNDLIIQKAEGSSTSTDYFSTSSS